jgi:hypothetical protein
MMSRKFLGGAAALAVVAALNLPTASFAFHGGGGGGHGGGWGGGGGHWGGGGGGVRMGGGVPAMGARIAPSASFAAAPAARFTGGAAPAFTGAAPGAGTAWRGAPTAWNGGNGAWHGGFHHRRFFPGAFAAGVAAGALGSYAYYGGPDYYYDSGYGDTYYDNSGYYDDGATVAVVPVTPGGGDPAYCAQRYRSYDPASGTYLGYDGLRHPCP